MKRSEVLARILITAGILIAVGAPLRFEVEGYAHAYQELAVESVGDGLLGPEEVRRLLGPDVPTAVIPQEPVVVVQARLPKASFVVDGAEFAYFDGMLGKASVRVRSERILAGQEAARAAGKRWGGSQKGRRLKVTPEQVARLEATGPLPEIFTLGTEIMYEGIYDECGILEAARKFTDRELILRCQRLIADLYEAGEPLADYFDRKVAPLPPPTGPRTM